MPNVNDIHVSSVFEVVSNCVFCAVPSTFMFHGRIQGGAPKIGKNMIFWRKIVIFHTKYPNNCCASLRSAQFF